VARRGAFVSHDLLTEALWPKKPPADPPANLSVLVSRARRALGDPSLILTGPGGYSFASDDRCRIDAEVFLARVKAGQRSLTTGQAETALHELGAALNVWGGEPLAEDAYQDWAQEYRSRLARAHLEALEAGSAAALRVGDAGQAVALAERAIAREPLREPAHLLLVRALAASGDTAGALAALDRLRHRFIEELGLDLSPEALELETRILRGEIHGPPLPAGTLARSRAAIRCGADPPGSGRRPRVLPIGLPGERTSFVGRAQALAEIGKALASNRIVTLVGGCGAGKSRLACRVAASRTALHPGGIWFTDLAAVGDPDLVPQAVAATLEIREQPGRPILDALVEHLRDADALLVLDHCEHLLDGVAHLAERLLGGCSQLRILATSLERLGITGEVLHRLAGLSVPEPGATAITVVKHSHAVQLLMERAGGVGTGIPLTDANADAVASICRHLQGLPLAIELAAAPVPMLGVDRIAASLGDQLRLVAGDGPEMLHERTLESVVDWSCGLLGFAEQRLLSRLAVFSGGFTLDAVEAVCAEPGERDMRKLLLHLVDRLLVSADTAGPTLDRYRLPRAVRARGLQRLQMDGETHRLRRKHAAFFLALAERAADAIWGLDQASWLERLETEQANLRAAVEWSLQQGDAETAVRLAGSLAQFWEMQGHYVEGCRLLDRVLSVSSTVSAPARARALLGAATLAASQGDLQRGTVACEQAVVLCRDQHLLGSVGGAAESWIPEEKERRAAWEIYVELVTRIGIQELHPEEGLLREALSSLYTLFDRTRQILHRYGPSVAVPSRGTLSLGLIAVTMLNRALRPLLASWHVELAHYESQRAPDLSPKDHERNWPRAQALRKAIVELQPTLVSYANLLSEVAGVPPLTG
jgi:predicted ATPase/DNA-binding SARP family transcriptional activator